MAVVAYSPIARGGAQGDDVLARIGKAHGKSAAQVSLRFLVQQGIVVIPRTSKVERLEENIALFDFALSELGDGGDSPARRAAATASSTGPGRRSGIEAVSSPGLALCRPGRRVRRAPVIPLKDALPS